MGSTTSPSASASAKSSIESTTCSRVELRSAVLLFATRGVVVRATRGGGATSGFFFGVQMSQTDSSRPCLHSVIYRSFLWCFVRLLEAEGDENASGPLNQFCVRALARHRNHYGRRRGEIPRPGIHALHSHLNRIRQ